MNREPYAHPYSGSGETWRAAFEGQLAEIEASARRLLPHGLRRTDFGAFMAPPRWQPEPTVKRAVGALQLVAFLRVLLDDPALRLRRISPAWLRGLASAVHLGVLAEQLHAAPFIDKGAIAKDAGRQRVEKRWGPTRDIRDERNRRWCDWNALLMRYEPSERERARAIAKQARRWGDSGTSEANVRDVIRSGYLQRT